MALLTVPYSVVAFLLWLLYVIAITTWFHVIPALIVVAIIVAIIGATILAIRHDDKVLAAKADGTWKPKVKRPNIVWEFIKAKKNNVCPLIEWE